MRVCVRVIVHLLAHLCVHLFVLAHVLLMRVRVRLVPSIAMSVARLEDVTVMNVGCSVQVLSEPCLLGARVLIVVVAQK
jgi:hypothetical protein